MEGYLGGKEFVVKRVQMEVGDGNAINIWSNYWLPKQRLIPISDSITQAQLNWTVVDLIDEYTRWWNMEKVRRLLPQREAYEVLNMMLPADSRPDSIVWEHEPNAQFSVKSAYRLFMSLGEERRLGEVSYGEERKRWWRKIWKMKVPNKIKIFAWRVCKNSLPTWKNLQAKKMVVDAKCRWCKVEEDINHALLYCSSFKGVLQAQLSFLQEYQVQVDFLQIMAQLIRRNKKGETGKLFLCAWGLWYRRNQLLYENRNLTPEQALDHALAGYNEFISVVEEQQKGC